MQFSLQYSYKSSALRVAPLHAGSQVKIDIVLTSDEKSTVFVGFNRSDSNRVKLGYKQIASVVRGTIQSIKDVLNTKNDMISSLKSDNIVICIPVFSSAESRRLRMYTALIDKHSLIMHQDENIPFRYVKTDIINNVIKIFIQRT